MWRINTQPQHLRTRIDANTRQTFYCVGAVPIEGPITPLQRRCWARFICVVFRMRHPRSRTFGMLCFANPIIAFRHMCTLLSESCSRRVLNRNHASARVCHCETQDVTCCWVPDDNRFDVSSRVFMCSSSFDRLVAEGPVNPWDGYQQRMGTVRGLRERGIVLVLDR
jgi:hypothetical protein